MKTVTYNPETHVLVPREPTEEMFAAANKIDDEMYCGGSQHGADIDQVYYAMIDAAPQPEPNPNWCAGCSPDNCSGCGTFYEIKKQRDELLSALKKLTDVFANIGITSGLYDDEQDALKSACAAIASAEGQK